MGHELPHRRFSLVIPVKNDRKIANLLTSLNSMHGFDDAELLIVRNGATQDVLDVTNTFAANHPNTVLVDTPISGMSSSRNLGICRSSGTYIAHLDSDITVGNDFLDSANQAVENHPDTDIILPRLRRDRGTNLMQRAVAHHYNILQQRNVPPLHTPGIIVRRSVHQEVGGFDERIRNGQDVDFKLRVTDRNIRFEPAIEIFHTNDTFRKFVRQSFLYGRDKSTISKTNVLAHRKAVIRDRAKKLLILPKTIRFLDQGLPAALFEGFVGFVTSAGFFTEEIRSFFKPQQTVNQSNALPCSTQANQFSN